MKPALIAIALLVALTGFGGCGQAPVVPEAQSQISVLQTSYELARAIETANCAVSDPAPKCDSVRTAGYKASAAITTANGDRTQDSITEANRKIIGYMTAAKELL